MNQGSGDEEPTTLTHGEKAAEKLQQQREKESVGEIDQKKQDEIRAACVAADVSELQRLAESAGGFLTDSLRQLACTR